MTGASPPSSFHRRVRAHLEAIYPGANAARLTDQVIAAVGIPADAARLPLEPIDRWNAADAVLISYGDSIVGDRAPIAELTEVLKRLRTAISTVHVLPFYPSSSDRGFSVIDYTAVDAVLGTWDDIDALADVADLMVDLVCNHASASSGWFNQFLADDTPGRDFFTTASPDADVSAVVRPRALPLLYERQTAAGIRHTWCTFSEDQVDLDYANPDVLLAMLEIIDLYIGHRARFLRLDAVAYLWKELGTPCIHLPQTHEIIRLWHTLLERRAPAAAIITETNVPNEENLTYFGNRNEAHLIYNFSLPPMVVDAMLQGRSNKLSTWMMRMPPAPLGCTYLNFLASHDGVGVRPAEGLLDADEIDELVAITEARGGLHATYDSAAGPRPYELNIALWDLLTGTAEQPDDGLALERFVCAHAIMIGVEGVPAIYVNSLFAEPNDRATADRTGIRRDIGRARLDAAAVHRLLDGDGSDRSRATAELLRLLEIRGRQPAFHPNATQFTLQLGDALFAFWRQSDDRTQSIFAIHNCTDANQDVPLARLNLIATDGWHDLVSGRVVAHVGETWAMAPYETVWLTNRTWTT